MKRSWRYKHNDSRGRDNFFSNKRRNYQPPNISSALETPFVPKLDLVDENNSKPSMFSPCKNQSSSGSPGDQDIDNLRTKFLEEIHTASNKLLEEQSKEITS